MTTTERSFLPAAGRDFLLPAYDPLTRLLGVDRARRALVEQSALRAYFRVLDIGCGTGSLAVLVKTLYPAVQVVGAGTGGEQQRLSLAMALVGGYRGGAAKVSGSSITLN